MRMLINYERDAALNRGSLWSTVFQTKSSRRHDAEIMHGAGVGK
jgi:hypothetical protein